MQKDELHPTLDGIAVLALHAVDAIARKELPVPEGLTWDVAEVVSRVKAREAEASPPAGVGVPVRKG
jgi:hypothetical protein